jgi:hypothetical protein
MHVSWLQIVALLLSVSACGCLGPVNDSAELAVGSGRIRLERRFETGFLPGAVIELKSWSSSSKSWREVARFHHDDPISIPLANVKTFGSSSVLFYLNTLLAASTDSGETWVLWNTRTGITPKCPFAAWIDTVDDLSSAGTGEMIVRCPAYDTPEQRVFRTSDSGRTWLFTEFK